MAGFILSETENVVVIATMDSKNEKTGNMIQTWIMRRDMHPVDAVKTGADVDICGNCPHRGTSCYVQVGKAPASIWRAYQRGAYQFLPISEYSEVFKGRAVRLGAYGDPAFMPFDVLSALSEAATDGRTGYTHQWRTTPALREFVMASCDTPAEMFEARANGWRTFRVSTNATPLVGEILCPASEEAGKRTTCIDCQLCDGKFDGADRRKTIMIPVHGLGASKFNILK